MVYNKVATFCAIMLGMYLISVPTTFATADAIPEITTVAGAETTLEHKKTTTTTVAPITTSTTTTSTVAPTTPSTTTTTQPTTTSSSTTTPPPSTTTTVAPPTPAPTPTPLPLIGKWNSTCIKIQMAAQLNFTYETKDNKTARAIYNIPANATVHDSLCEYNTIQSIDLNWGPDSAVHSLMIQFAVNDSKVDMNMISVAIPVDASEFPNAKADQHIQLLYRGETFEAPLHMSYHCTRVQKLNFTETVDNSTVIGTIELSHVQFEAFRTKNSSSFSEAHDCDSSETPNIVPIAVGIALVTLILIVLISYLCARRRSTSQGYMSF